MLKNKNPEDANLLFALMIHRYLLKVMYKKLSVNDIALFKSSICFKEISEI